MQLGLFSDFNPPPRSKPRRRVLDNLVGQTFGRWTVLRRTSRLRPTDADIWLCECSCKQKTQTRISGAALRNGRARNCHHCVEIVANRKRPFEALYNGVLARHQIRNRRRVEGGKLPIVWELTFDEFVLFTDQSFCTYCFEPIHWAGHCHGKNGAAYNLDRKDPDPQLGYRKSNLVVCCRTCNFAKGNRYLYDRWLEMTVPLRRERLRQFIWNPDADPKFRTFLRRWVQTIQAEFPDLLSEDLIQVAS